MKMNRLEKLFIHSPLRLYFLRKSEVPLVLSNLDLAADSVCLEVGCGAGAGTLLINRYLDCRRVIGVDIDPEMITRSRRYLNHPPGWARGIRNNNIEFICEDAASLSFPDNSFDGVFHFAVLDHIPEWAEVVSEVSRVLKIGGVYSFEEYLLTPSSNGQWGHVSIAERELKMALENSGFVVQSFQMMKRLPRCFVRAVKKGS